LRAANFQRTRTQAAIVFCSEGNFKIPLYRWPAWERGEEMQTTREANLSNDSRQTVALGVPGIVQSSICSSSHANSS